MLETKCYERPKIFWKRKISILKTLNGQFTKNHQHCSLILCFPSSGVHQMPGDCLLNTDLLSRQVNLEKKNAYDCSVAHHHEVLRWEELEVHITTNKLFLLLNIWMLKSIHHKMYNVLIPERRFNCIFLLLCHFITTEAKQLFQVLFEVVPEVIQFYLTISVKILTFRVLKWGEHHLLENS